MLLISITKRTSKSNTEKQSATNRNLINRPRARYLIESKRVRIVFVLSSWNYQAVTFASIYHYYNYSG